MFKKRKLIIYLFVLSSVLSLKAADGHPTPIADFDIGNLCFGSITNFTNTSSRLENEAYYWEIFQTGNSVPIYTTSATNISFQFPAKTTYTVVLYVANYVTPTHFHWDQTTRVIAVDSILIANFDFNLCHSRAVNLSCCATNYLWDFGDGSPTSTSPSVVHTYTNGNTYTITLIAYNGTQSDTVSRAITPYFNTFTGDFTVSFNMDTVVFKSLNDSTVISIADTDWEWDFGDGGTVDTFGMAGWKVKHYYRPQERDSVYTVSLLLKDPCFENRGEKTVRIKGIGKNVTGTTVFPSPVVHGYLSVETNRKDALLQIRIIDCLGKQLDDLVPSEYAYGYYFYIGTIPAGVYIVQLVFTDRIENYKIIKQ